MGLERLFVWPRKVLREISRNGPGSAVRHALRRALLEGGGARAEEVAALHAKVRDLQGEIAVLQSALPSDGAPGVAGRSADSRSHSAVHAEALAWLADRAAREATASAPVRADGDLVSVILPTWNRASLIGDAIRSVQAQTYRNWELLVIDDGSTDGTADLVRAAGLEDPRVRYVQEPHRGQSAARNAGLARARGSLVAYIDSDDEWYAGYLARMVEALDAAPDADAAYGAILITGDGSPTHILDAPFDRQRLFEENTISIEVFVHRRRLFERLGGFDETLTRLVDWDLILRYTAERPPLAVPVLGAHYRAGSWPRVSNQESQAFAASRIRARHAPRQGWPGRVLYALEFYPHVSETYVATEIAASRRRGIDVAVWSEHDPPVPYDTDVPVFRGDLSEAIARFDPHVVHVHHLYRALRYAPIVEAAGRPMTVRGHGFESTPERMAETRASRTIRAVFQFPHLMPPGADDRFHAMPAVFDPEWFYPEGDQDPRLVLRTGLASRTKDMPLFIQLAARCPRHRFVLAPCWSVAHAEHLDELRALNRSLGEPVDIRANLAPRDVADLVRRAGVALHTHGLVEPYGMPVSIVEAMAAGAYVIARHAPAAASFIGPAGRTYETIDQAEALLKDTEAWTADDWRAARVRSIERAYSRHAAPDVLRPLWAEWARLAGRRVAATLP